MKGSLAGVASCGVPRRDSSDLAMGISRIGRSKKHEGLPGSPERPSLNGSGQCRARTCDPVIKSHLLYQLS